MNKKMYEEFKHLQEETVLLRRMALLLEVILKAYPLDLDLEHVVIIEDALLGYKNFKREHRDE